MQTYSNVHSRGLANNKMQMLHEDSLKGVTVNGQMLVSTEYQPLYQVKTRIIFIKETNKSTWRRGNCWFGFNTVNFFFLFIARYSYSFQSIQLKTACMSSRLRLRPLCVWEILTVFKGTNIRLNE